ncbi:MAG TPA: DUF484 family protein [Gammaproteobacteria bacterium]|nr:DUF484 family protein [Gammaproteobacteria bacterium]
MSIQQQKSRLDEGFEREVVRFLRDNPGFFGDHPDLLADMVLPHDTGGAVSLLEKQLSVLRDQKGELRARLNKLVENARQNELLIERIHHLTLDLLDADSLDAVLAATRSQLESNFNADAVTLRLFNLGAEQQAVLADTHPDLLHEGEALMEAFERSIRGCKPVCGRFTEAQLRLLFDDAPIASAALIPLCTNDARDTCWGLLAIGSKDPARYHVDMGVMFLDLIGGILARVLRPWLRA